MENLKAALSNFLARFKKAIFIISLGVGGLLLTLSGLNLIQLSQNVVLFFGFLFLILAALSYLLD
ncbi:MAG: hypothetical protein V1808_05020 [Candidatus Daviesbacteria bacterium]